MDINNIPPLRVEILNIVKAFLWFNILIFIALYDCHIPINKAVIMGRSPKSDI